MEINFKNQQTFGLLFIDPNIKRQLQSDIMKTQIKPDAYKEVISDIIELSNDSKNIIKVTKTGCITTYNKSKGTSSACYGTNLAKAFLHALKSTRNSEYSAFLSAEKI